MKTFLIVLLAMLMSTWASALFAQTPCAGVELREVDSLAGLPALLRVAVPKATHALDGIADRGADFTIGDVLVNDLPRRRFLLAAVGPACSIIGVEYGGIAFHTEWFAFRLIREGWRQDGLPHATSRGPKTMADLLTFLETSKP